MACGCNGANNKRVVVNQTLGMQQTQIQQIQSCPPCFKRFPFNVSCPGERLEPGETIVGTSCNVVIDQIEGCAIQACTATGTTLNPCTGEPLSCPVTVFAVTATHVRFQITTIITIQKADGTQRMVTCSRTASVGLGTSFDQLVVPCYKCNNPGTCNLVPVVESCTAVVSGGAMNLSVDITIRIDCA